MNSKSKRYLFFVELGETVVFEPHVFLYLGLIILLIFRVFNDFFVTERYDQTTDGTISILWALWSNWPLRSGAEFATSFGGGLEFPLSRQLLYMT